MDCINRVEHTLLTAGFRIADDGVFWVTIPGCYNVDIAIREKEVIIREQDIEHDFVYWWFLNTEEKIFAKLDEVFATIENYGGVYVEGTK